MFDLEQALSTWRDSFKHNRNILPKDLDELERHLRDQIDVLILEGDSQESAFRKALEELGGHTVVDIEYSKVYWEKVYFHNQLGNELRWRTAMLRNYIKIAWRNIQRHPGYAAINIAGLAIGIACCLLILVFVRYELSYDRFHADANQVYKIYSHFENTSPSALTSAPVAVTAVSEIPEISAFTRLFRHWNTPLISHDELASLETEVLFADSSFFNLFSFPLVRGNPSTVLTAPLSIVISETMAEKYFGDSDPVGQTLKFNTQNTLTVTGIMANMPANSHIQAELLISMSSLPEIFWPSMLDMWTFNNFYSYIRLQEGSSPEEIKAKLLALRSRHVENDQTELHLQPILDIYNHSDLSNEITSGTDIRYIYILVALGILILLMASINYTNLVIARSASRAREVGLRKVVGAHRSQLMQQFFGESMLQSASALIVGLCTAWLLLPLVRTLTGKQLSVSLLDGWVVGGLIAIFFLTVLATGSYPALVLSRYWPADILRSTQSLKTRSKTSRHLPVSFQFATTSIFLIAALVIIGQLRYLQSTKIGFSKEQVVVIPIQDTEVREHFETLSQTLSSQAGVITVGAGNSYPGSSMPSGNLRWEGLPEEEFITTFGTWINDDYLDVLEINVMAGRNFSNTRDVDQNVVLVNHTAVQAMGLQSPEEALGKSIETSLDSRSPAQIIGVVEDFHYSSLHHRIEPLVMFLQPGSSSRILVKISANNITGALGNIRTVWNQYASTQPFMYSFLNEDFDRLYRSEAQWGKIMGYAALIAILMSCLGLISLATFIVEQRKKEVGIRKVLGASVGSVVYLINKDFFLPVFLGFVVGVPIAYLAMNRWLQMFAYNTGIQPRIFVLAGAITFFSAFLAVCYQSFKSATADPVKSIARE